MRIAVISDIHGNLPALDAVLADIERARADLIVVGGDVAAGGPMPRETLDRLRELGDRARFVRGNADRELVNACDGRALGPGLPDAARQELAWAAAQLDRSHRDFMAGFEDRVVVDVDGLGPVLCCHASPRNDVDIFTVRSPDDRVRRLFAGVGERVVTCGHTHMQFVRELDGMRIVNSGSVGMPYGEPGAYWALLGPGIELSRTDYDLEQAAALIRGTDYPQAGQFADGHVLRPPTAEEAVTVFEGMSERQA